MPATAIPLLTFVRSSSGTLSVRMSRTSWLSASICSFCRRVVGEVALGLAHDPGLGRDAEADLGAGADDHLGRAAADVEHERRRRVGGVALAGRAQVGEPRLLVAFEDVGGDAVALLDRLGELLAVV